MENGETTAEAAYRETFEEAGAEVVVDAPFAMVSVAHINQVHLFYRGHMATPAHAAGEESLEVALLTPDEIPWGALAFRTVAFCLKRYFADREHGFFGFHETTITPLPEHPGGGSEKTEYAP
jgi:ADP-ribose pyrophosphatase YjhB (NUDIX family)